MVGCAAFGCSSRSEKGHHMYGFPKDQERMKRWMVMVRRQNLQITGDSNRRKLCHVHFEDDQFIATKKRGTLRLRPDAVPTIFTHRPKPKRRKPPARRGPQEPIRRATDHTYHSKLNSGVAAQDSTSPDFVPSVFPPTQQSHLSRNWGRNKRKRLADDISTPAHPPVAWTTKQGQEKEPGVVLPTLYEVEVIDQESSLGPRCQAPGSSLTGETVADPLISSEGSAGILAKRAPAVKKEDVIEVTVGETGEKTHTTDVSESPETFGIEGRYAAGTWEQATVEAIMSLRLLGTTVTTNQVAQTIIENLKDENDFLRVQNANMEAELKAKQWMHEQEVRDLQERLETLEQKCSCGAMSEKTDIASETALSDVMVAQIKTESDVCEWDLQGNGIY